MDIIEYVEQVLGLKLLEYQKILLRKFVQGKKPIRGYRRHLPLYEDDWLIPQEILDEVFSPFEIQGDENSDKS